MCKGGRGAAPQPCSRLLQRQVVSSSRCPSHTGQGVAARVSPGQQTAREHLQLSEGRVLLGRHHILQHIARHKASLCSLSCNSSPGELPPQHVPPAASPRACCCSHQCMDGKRWCSNWHRPFCLAQARREIAADKKTSLFSARLCSCVVCSDLCKLFARVLESLGDVASYHHQAKRREIANWLEWIYYPKKETTQIPIFSPPPSLYFYPHHGARESAEHIELKVANLSFKPLYF